MFNFEIECSKVLKSDVFSIAPSFRWPNNRESLCGTEIWIWSEISFLRVDTINLMSARNGKVGRIYFLIVMPCTVRWGSIFSWLWLSPQHTSLATWEEGAWWSTTRRNWSRVGHGGWVAQGGTHRHGGRRGSVTRPRNQKSHLLLGGYNVKRRVIPENLPSSVKEQRLSPQKSQIYTFSL